MNRLGQAGESGMCVKYLLRPVSTGALVVPFGMPLTPAPADPVPFLRQPSQRCPYVDHETAPARVEELGARLAERRKTIEKSKSMLAGLAGREPRSMFSTRRL